MFSPSSRISPSARCSGYSSYMRLKVRSSVDLPQPDGPMNAVTLLLGDVEVDVLQRVEPAVVEIEVAHRDLGASRSARATLAGRIGHGVHGCLSVLLRNSARARMLRTSTPRVIRNAPAQASCCQSSYGLIANLKIITGRFAIGCAQVAGPELVVERGEQQRRGLAGDARHREQHAGDDAGARGAQRDASGSPSTSARRARRRPRAARWAPAAACSRWCARPPGSRSAPARATPAQPEKCLDVRHDDRVDEQADHDRRRRQQDVVDEARDAARASRRWPYSAR